MLHEIIASSLYIPLSKEEICESNHGVWSPAAPVERWYYYIKIRLLSFLKIGNSSLSPRNNSERNEKWARRRWLLCLPKQRCINASRKAMSQQPARSSYYAGTTTTSMDGTAYYVYSIFCRMTFYYALGDRCNMAPLAIGVRGIWGFWNFGTSPLLWIPGPTAI